MKSGFIDEPLLEFGGGDEHVDVREGLRRWGPLDTGEPFAPTAIRLGVVGTAKTIEGFCNWIETITKGVPAKSTHLERLFPSFPGCGGTSGLTARLTTDAKSTRTVPHRRVKEFVGLDDVMESVTQLTSLFLEELRYLRESGTIDVLVCALPSDVLRLLAPPSVGKQRREARGGSPVRYDLHDFLKSRAMSLGRPTQLVLPTTYGQKIPPGVLAAIGMKRRPLQDEATRAWNFYVANYYKAGGIPWRMVRDPSTLTTCHVGVSFYKTSDGSRVRTSLAQVFDERGRGIIVRGGNAVEDRKDRTPHLHEFDAYSLLSSALRVYRREHKNSPARVVIHKTSKYYPEEVAGFAEAIDEKGIEELELLYLRKSEIRLFREGQYPPLRGTYLLPAEDESLLILNTRGSIPFYKTYPGMYVPRSLEISVHQSERSAVELGNEVLALTKMNWNNTQFDASEPITIRGSRNVGNLLRYLDEDALIEPRYAYYI